MIRKDANVKSSLHILGLSEDEIEVYLALLAASASPLELSRRTGIGRTKVYGTLEVLEKRSLVARQVDEKGARFVVTEPTNLLIHMGDLEAKLKLQLETFHQVMPVLNALRGVGQASQFAVRTYEGVEGFKQMLWHELKTKGELLSLGGGDVEELVLSTTWAARHRQHSVEAGYSVREILNSEIDLPTPISNREYLQRYNCRGISVHVVPLENQITIYNDTVAIYNWRQDKKLGIEIVSKSFANTMRGTFEAFWRLTEPSSSRAVR